MEKAMQLVMKLPDQVKESVIDVQTGTLPINGKRCDVVAIILEKALTADEETEIKHFRKCVKVSCGHMQYAPEIKHSVVYFKY